MSKPPVKAKAPTVDPVTQNLINRAKEIVNSLEALATPNQNSDPYLQRLALWEDLSLLQAAIKDTEYDLRVALFSGAFPNPKEGTNVHKLPDGRELVGKHTINRKIDEAALKPVLDVLRKKGVANTDQLVRYKAELAKSEWNSLSDENKLVFSPAVIATPGSPQFEVRIPKRAKR